MASLASAVAIFEPFLAFVLLSNARFVLFCLISFALRATLEKRVCLRFRLAIYVFSLSLGIMAWERENFKLIYVCVEKKSKILEYGQFDVQVIGKIL